MTGLDVSPKRRGGKSGGDDFDDFDDWHQFFRSSDNPTGKGKSKTKKHR